MKSFLKKMRLCTLLTFAMFLSIQEANAQWQLLRLLVGSSARSTVARGVARSAVRSAVRTTRPVRKMVRVVDALGRVRNEERIVEEVVETDNQNEEDNDYQYSLEGVNQISTQQEIYNQQFLANEYQIDAQTYYSHVVWQTREQWAFMACLCRKFTWRDGRVQRGRVAQYMTEIGFRINGNMPVERWHIPMFP